MFRLIKLGFFVMALAAFAWFGATAKLGSQTLFQHLRAIGQTKESQDLVDGARQAAAPLVDDARRRITGHEALAKDGAKGDRTAADPQDSDGGSPEERVSTADRQALHRLIRRIDR